MCTLCTCEDTFPYATIIHSRESLALDLKGCNRLFKTHALLPFASYPFFFPASLFAASACEKIVSALPPQPSPIYAHLGPLSFITVKKVLPKSQLNFLNGFFLSGWRAPPKSRGAGLLLRSCLAFSFLLGGVTFVVSGRVLQIVLSYQVTGMVIVWSRTWVRNGVFRIMLAFPFAPINSLL